MNKKFNVRKIAAAVVIVVLLILAAILGVRVASLVDLTMEEIERTPTPVPPYGNVLRVTVDPSLPTPPPVLRSGSEGELVTKLQQRLQELGYYTTAVDGQFGPGTREAVTLFQRQHGLDADGIVGEETSALLYSDQAHQIVITPTPTTAPTSPPAQQSSAAATDASFVMAEELSDMLRAGSQGDEVMQLQQRLQTLGYYGGALDGDFGAGTRKAVVQFQKASGLDADGIVGNATWKELRSEQAKSAPTPLPLADGVPGTLANGMPMLINRENYLPDHYQPVELVNMSEYCDTEIVKIKYSGIQAERVAVDALMAMLRYAHNEGITVWQVSAAYRTLNDQQSIFDQKVQEYLDRDFSRKNAESAARQTVADPGTSEHHLGLAFDVTVPGVSFAGTEQARWLAEHCWEWGFILRYTEEKEAITGYLAEPWHIRYVGTQHSLAMRDGNLCLEEYVGQAGAL